MNPRPLDIRFPGTIAGFDEAFAVLRDALDDTALAAQPRFNVELVFEEVVANIVRHAAVPGGTPQVHVTLDVDAAAARLAFEDDGRPFDPRGREDPVPARTLDEAPVGGLGLMMVRRVASALDYERTPGGHNRLVVTVPATASAAG